MPYNLAWNCTSNTTSADLANTRVHHQTPSPACSLLFLSSFPERKRRHISSRCERLKVNSFSRMAYSCNRRRTTIIPARASMPKWDKSVPITISRDLAATNGTRYAGLCQCGFYAGSGQTSQLLMSHSYEKASAAAWKTIPSWFVWGERDQLIPAAHEAPSPRCALCSSSPHQTAMVVAPTC